MLLRLSASLHYPITVTELLKRPGDNIRQGEAIFAYYYRTTVTEGDGLGNKHDVLKTFPTRFESAVDGELVAWKVRKGAVIEKPIDIAEINEPCSHEIQYGGMCGRCGKDMNEFNYNTEVLDSSRAPIRMVHDNSALTVSENEATRVEEDAKRRLLSSRRLSLVVDLDQTIIHATVDPTVAEWQQDKDNPNHEAVKDVRAFQLVDDGPGMKGCWYYIKLRPGLEEFLRNISTLFELHIYTMGTRAYAQHIASIVDPDRKIFGDRILSRDESGSLTAKNLQRLFPVDTKMVVIIDDRGDVWKWTDNLIKVVPYDFFVGIGDINSSFLPKKQEFKGFPLGAAKSKKELDSKETETARTTTNGSSATNADEQTTTEISALEQLVTMGGGDNPVLLQEQATEQEETIAHQVEERPLLQKQKQLDAEDEAAELLAAGENGDSSSSDSHDSSRHRHHLLEDNDTELSKLEERLKAVHTAFFDEYDRRRTSSLGGRVSALRGQRVPSKDKDIDLRIVPDIKVIMPQIKRPVLQSVDLVFSGVLPLGTDTQNADISLWAKSFGAIISQKISSKTTHLVAGRNRTAKVREATRYPNIKIVTVQWLLDSITQWKRLDEEPYLVPVNPEDRGGLIGADNISPWDPSKSNGSLDDFSFLTSSEEDFGMTGDDDDSGDDDGDSEGNNTESDTSKRRVRANNNMNDIDKEILQSAGLTEHSPIGYDAEQQAAVHDELREFLGSDNEDSESDSDFSPGTSFGEQQRPVTPSGKKRKRGEDGDESYEESSAGEDRGEGTASSGSGSGSGSISAAGAGAGSGGPAASSSGSSRLARKIKLSHERNTGLKNVSTIRSRGSSEAPDVVPVPNPTPNADDDDDIGDESDTTEYNSNNNDDVDPEDDEDALEREMMAAFEDGEGEEDRGDGGGPGA
ncbi:RNA polymerase II C-terminal domain phosphatase component [Histoplasma capsulatum var. duboisii H88]|uniref:RNA polymerase II subunit A C-terminal domain phosphatase n=1 Tax=Ajellomyces capsulatus (strain H88) TaxID=544711 RepID=A0A8A1LGR2_AJEC8|nr:RNA polymerase II C-terminal domain phosphatase component [Histoplasma capsulatum var. duboisii H88]